MPGSLSDLLALGKAAAERRALAQQLGDWQGPPAPVDYGPPEGSIRRALGDLLTTGMEAAKGFVGIPPAEPTRSNALGELLAAAMPLMGGIKALKTAQGAKALAAEAKPAIRAFHGSPHDFDQFSLSKIGTGEGAQAYGHGLYFAEKEGTAKAYRDALAPPEIRVGGQPHPPLNTESPVDMALADLANGKPMSDAVLDRGFDPKFAQEYKQAVAKYQGQVERVNPGRMYEVNIHADPADFLDWDKPLSQQPAGEKIKQWIGNDAEAWEAVKGKTGAEFNGGQWGLPERAQRQSDFLKAQGIPGIKYLDAGSRSAGEGSRNYVVFDDKLISIVKKYGIAGAVSAGLINQAQAKQLKEQGY